MVFQTSIWNFSLVKGGRSKWLTTIWYFVFSWMLHTCGVMLKKFIFWPRLYLFTALTNVLGLSSDLSIHACLQDKVCLLTKVSLVLCSQCSIFQCFKSAIIFPVDSVPVSSESDSDSAYCTKNPLFSWMLWIFFENDYGWANFDLLQILIFLLTVSYPNCC